MKTSPMIAAAGLLLALAGCGKSDAPPSAQLPQLPQVPLSQRPAQAKPFWLNGVTLGCPLPSREFFTFKFAGMGATVRGAGFNQPAVVIQQIGQRSFAVRTQQRTFEFGSALGEIGTESQLMRFHQGGDKDKKEFLCFIHMDGQYIPHDNSMLVFQAMTGNWSCAGDIGTFGLDASGAFRWGKAGGSVVFSSRQRRSDQVEMHLLASPDKDGLVSDYRMLRVNAMGAAQGTITIDGQACRKS